MQTKNFLLLAALTASTTIGSLAIAPSAEAILYNLSAQLSDNTSLIGSFEYAPTSYSNILLSVQAGPGALTSFTYNSNDSGATVNNVTSSGFTISYATPNRFLALVFSSPLTGTFADQNISIQPTSNANFNPSNEGASNGSTTDLRGVTSGTVTAVPLESDALPIVRAAAFMAGGLWFKRRRAQAKANLEFLTADQEK